MKCDRHTLSHSVGQIIQNDHNMTKKVKNGGIACCCFKNKFFKFIVSQKLETGEFLPSQRFNGLKKYFQKNNNEFIYVLLIII